LIAQGATHLPFKAAPTLISRRSARGRLDQDRCLLALHGFTLTNAGGEQTLIKYKLMPKAGNLGLNPYEAAWTLRL
jgi:hypothetical protein